MIGLPFNDLSCLGALTQVVADLVNNRDPYIVEIAAKHPTTESLAAWIRTLPQDDDDGDPNDGPKLEACDPPQRLIIPSARPNCFERGPLYMAASEFIDPHPVRQLATLDTPAGLHTFPLENGAPIVLDPNVNETTLKCGVAMTQPGPVAIDAHDALEWSARLAADAAGNSNVRNGASRVRRARNAVMRLVDEGVVPAETEIDAMGWLFALAESAARRYGARALAMVRSAAHAVGEILDEVLARTQRNLGFEIDGLHFTAPQWVTQLGSAAGHIGLDLGAAVLRSKLDAYGIGADLVGLVEEELNHEGFSLGVLAHPPTLKAFSQRK